MTPKYKEGDKLIFINNFALVDRYAVIDRISLSKEKYYYTIYYNKSQRPPYNKEFDIKNLEFSTELMSKLQKVLE